MHVCNDNSFEQRDEGCAASSMQLIELGEIDAHDLEEAFCMGNVVEICTPAKRGHLRTDRIKVCIHLAVSRDDARLRSLVYDALNDSMGQQWTHVKAVESEKSCLGPPAQPGWRSEPILAETKHGEGPSKVVPCP